MNRNRFGLRTRVITLFGIGALLLSMLLAGVTYTLTRNQLLERRENFSIENALQNAIQLNGQLSSRTDPGRLVGLMEQLVIPDGAQQGILFRGEYYWTDPLAFTEDAMPRSLVRQMVIGAPSEMTFASTPSAPEEDLAPQTVLRVERLNYGLRAQIRQLARSTLIAPEIDTSLLRPAPDTSLLPPVDELDSDARLAQLTVEAVVLIVRNEALELAQSTGITPDRVGSGSSGAPSEMYYAVTYPLPDAAANSAYVLATPLVDIEDTLGELNATLLGAAAITTLLGIGFGVYVATRLFSPLAEISQAAEQIAEGNLSTRLDEEADPDLRRLVHSFNDMTSALEERIERDSRFASDVSHELRSPLMTLTGSVALLEKRRDEMPERSVVALDLLSADIRRFKVLVEDLLEISRFDVGAVQLETEEVMLGEFVRQALRAATSGRDIPIIHTDATDELIVDIDKRRIAQVIRNLSENADKYADGVTQARISRVGDGVRIALEDEGPGVPIDEREVIFERFSRGSEGGRRGSGSGVGLGLSLVTEHLRLHGGTISVADRVDGLLGSRFIIDLPDVVVDD